MDPGLLTPYALMLSVGHDEYWSDEMRARIEAFIGRGGNVAFFSGNICGYRIHFTDGDSAFTCAKVRPSGKDRGTWEVDHWSDVRPENGVTGTSIRQAGGWWDGRRDTVGYTVQHAAHWVYESTALKDSDVFCADPAFPLVGYQATAPPSPGSAAWPSSPATRGRRSASSYWVAELGEAWVRSSPHAAATMSLYTSDRGGIVFNGATTDWPCLVGRNAEVEQITRNVLDRLRLRAVPDPSTLARAARPHARRGRGASALPRGHGRAAIVVVSLDRRCVWRVTAGAV